MVMLEDKSESEEIITNSRFVFMEGLVAQPTLPSQDPGKAPSGSQVSTAGVAGQEAPRSNKEGLSQTI